MTDDRRAMSPSSSSDFVAMDDHTRTRGISPLPIHSLTAAASLSLDEGMKATRQFVARKRIFRLHRLRKQLYQRLQKREEQLGLKEGEVPMGEVILTLIVLTVVLGGVLSSALAMWTQQSMVTYIAFAIVPILVGPTVLIQRWTLHWMMSNIRREIQRIRNMANELAGQRLRLQNETVTLENEYHRIVDVEDRFREIILQQGKSVPDVRALVKEHAYVQKEIRHEQELRELQDLFSIVMNSDENSNGRVGRTEMNRLIQRLQFFAAENGKFVDEDLIRATFQRSLLKNAGTSQSTFSMFNVVQTALSDEEEYHHHQQQQHDEEGTMFVDEDPVGGMTSRSTSIFYEMDMEKGLWKPHTSTSIFYEMDMEKGLWKPHTQQQTKNVRVTPTGLVMTNSVEEESGEGGLARPIRASPKVVR